MTCSPVKPVITLGVNEVKWHDAFRGFRVSFGQTTEPLELYPNQRPLHERRQESATPTVEDSLASSLIPTDTAATATSVSIDLSHEGDGENWFPEIGTAGPQLPIDIDCKDCLTRGSLELSQGEWELLDKEDWGNIDSFTDIFKVGFVRFNLKEFFAHVELQVTPSIEGSQSFTFFSLAVPGVTGFTVRIQIYLRLYQRGHDLTQMNDSFPRLAKPGSCSSHSSVSRGNFLAPLS